jgi:monoamine oxidase
MRMLCAMTCDTDVIVIGAGVAGLSAASALRAAGKCCVVLEATSRIGGRAYTARPAALAGAAFDHGASWLHAAERNPLVTIAQDHGEALHNADRARTRQVLVDGRPASAAERAAYAAALDRVEQHAGSRAASGPDIAFADALEALRDDPWTATAEFWEACLIAAADPRDFSLQDWQANALNGSNLTVEGGLGAFVERRLGALAGRVCLNARAVRISWDGRIRVDTPQGSLSADACVVTVSTGVLAGGRLCFDPPLPPDVQQAIHGLPMGLLTKIALPATGTDRLGLADDTGLSRRITRDEPAMSFIAWQSGTAHITGFVGGPAAWELARAGAAVTEDFARAELRRMLGSQADRNLGPAVVGNWAGNTAYLGAYAYARPGHAGARAVLATPLADGRLVFAGEATCTDGLAGTVGGAWRSGQKAAQVVLEADAPAAG